jgi:hypothetical protein
MNFSLSFRAVSTGPSGPRMHHNQMHYEYVIRNEKITERTPEYQNDLLQKQISINLAKWHGYLVG